MILSNLGVIKSSGSLLSNGLVSVYKADGNNNLTVKNAWNGNGNVIDSKSGANGTIAAPSGTSWVPSTMTYGSGKVGSGAFTFNGSNFISLPADTLTFTKDFSMSMWVYIPSSVNSGFNLLSAYDNSLGYTTVRGWRLIYSYVNNQIEFRLGETYSTNPNNTVAPMTLKDQWVHIVATRKLSAQSTIYINGVQAAQTTNSINPIYNSNNLAYIAASYYSFSPPFYTGLAQNGVKIDSIQTWESELNQNFVTELYNSGNGQEYPFTVSNALTATTKDTYSTNHGVAGGDLVYTTGKSENAFSFNGTNAYVQLPNNCFNNLTSSFSVSLWAKATVSPGNAMFISAWTLSSVWNGWYIETSFGNINFIGYKNNLVSFSASTTGAQVTAGNWVNIVCVFEDNVSVKIYANGVLLANGTTNKTAPAYHNPTYVSIGCNQYTASSRQEFFNGAIDELNVWNRVLTATEVTELYNSGSGKFYPYQ